MNLLYPRFPLRQLPMIIRTALICAVLAGLYGAVHDQVSYTISPEYFTRLKFLQFEWCDFGWPPRAFAALVGFLATWWVGLIGGWLVGRMGLAELAERSPDRNLPRILMLAFTVAVVSGFVGVLCGIVVSRGDLSGWEDWQRLLELKDLPAFVVVAYLHWASYLGGALGLICALIYVKRRLAQAQESSSASE